MNYKIGLIVFSDGTKILDTSTNQITLITGKNEEITILPQHIPVLIDWAKSSIKKFIIYDSRGSVGKKIFFDSGIFRFADNQAVAHIVGFAAK